MTGVMTTVKGQTTGWEIRAAREVCRLIRWLPFAMAVKSPIFIERSQISLLNLIRA